MRFLDRLALARNCKYYQNLHPWSAHKCKLMNWATTSHTLASRLGSTVSRAVKQTKTEVLCSTRTWENPSTFMHENQSLFHASSRTYFKNQHLIAKHKFRSKRNQTSMYSKLLSLGRVRTDCSERCGFSRICTYDRCITMFPTPPSRLTISTNETYVLIISKMTMDWKQSSDKKRFAMSVSKTTRKPRLAFPYSI